jgi:hypothetical protein
MGSRNTANPKSTARKLEMPSYELDKLVMLLSADWFFPYWDLIGIFTKDKRKSLLREGCREIVRQIMSTATQYWGINFSEARVKESRAMLDALMKRCDLEEVNVNRIIGLISKEDSLIDDGTRWLIVSMTEQLLDGSVTAPLGIAITAGLRQVRDERINLDEIDFTKCCLNSASTWDQYLRNATPDLPAMLAYNLSAIASDSKFEVLWGFINVNLTAKQRYELLSWYRSRGQSLTGEPLRLAQDA